MDLCDEWQRIVGVAVTAGLAVARQHRRAGESCRRSPVSSEAFQQFDDGAKELN